MRIASMLIALAAGASLHAATMYNVTPILLPGDVYSMNNVGQFVGFASGGSGYIGTADGSFTNISTPSGSTGVVPIHLNDLGYVTGFAAVGNTQQAFIGSTSSSTLIAAPPGLAFVHSMGTGINNSNQISANGRDSNGFNWAFIGTAGGSTLIPLPSGWFGIFDMAGINDAGQVTGYGVTNGGQHEGFIGTLAGTTPIPFLPDSTSVSSSGTINNSGQVAGIADGSASIEAFVGDDAGVAPVPPPVGCIDMHPTFPLAINDLNVVVGECRTDLTGGYTPWIWDPVNGTQLLNDVVPAGWTITQALDINNRGDILVKGNSGGADEYLLLEAPVPEPATWCLMATGLLLLAVRRRSGPSSPA
jgi:PEP-CTERM motif